jgi:prevent-host-death family protein
LSLNAWVLRELGGQTAAAPVAEPLATVETAVVPVARQAPSPARRPLTADALLATKSLAPRPATWPDLAMKRVKIAELKDHLSEHLRAVEAGAEIEVTDRNRPVARIIPIRAAATVEIIPASKPFAAIRDQRYKPARWPTSSLSLLLEERREP